MLTQEREWCSSVHGIESVSACSTQRASPAHKGLPAGLADDGLGCLIGLELGLAALVGVLRIPLPLLLRLGSLDVSVSD